MRKDRKRNGLVGLWFAALALTACDGSCDITRSGPSEQTQVSNMPAEPQGQISAHSEFQQPHSLVFLGDSLTAGYRLSPDEAFPAQVETLMREQGVSGWKIVNAGVSGDTSRGGLERLGWVLKADPSAVFVCLGANDGLRGVSLASTRDNLERIINTIKEAGSQVLLAGMELPENYGPDYRLEFRQMYQSLARDHDVPLLPFLLENMALKVDLTLDDGIHPNAKGARVIAENVFRFLQSEIFSKSQ